MYVSSLLPNTPIKINDTAITNETLVSNMAIMTIGSCSFRFEYIKKSISPLQEPNGVDIHVPKKVNTEQYTSNHVVQN